MKIINNSTTSSGDQNACPQKKTLSQEQILAKLKHAKALIDSLNRALAASQNMDEADTDGRLVTVTLTGFNYEARYSQKEGYYILTEGPSGNMRYNCPEEIGKPSFLETLADMVYKSITEWEQGFGWECDFLGDEEDEYCE